MNRVELAREIWIHNLQAVSPLSGPITIESCFECADAFIAEAERQREAEKPLEVGCNVIRRGYDIHGYITMYSEDICKWIVRWENGATSEEAGVNLKRIDPQSSEPETRYRKEAWCQDCKGVAIDCNTCNCRVSKPTNFQPKEHNNEH